LTTNVYLQTVDLVYVYAGPSADSGCNGDVVVHSSSVGDTTLSTAFRYLNPPVPACTVPAWDAAWVGVRAQFRLQEGLPLSLLDVLPSDWTSALAVQTDRIRLFNPQANSTNVTIDIIPSVNSSFVRSIDLFVSIENAVRARSPLFFTGLAAVHLDATYLPSPSPLLKCWDNSYQAVCSPAPAEGGLSTGEVVAITSGSIVAVSLIAFLAYRKYVGPRQASLLPRLAAEGGGAYGTLK